MTLTTNGAVTVGAQTVFNATVTNAAASVAWAFGDGTTFAGSSTTTGHTYATAGNYLASVTVTDALRHSATASTTATVNPLPPPPGPSYAVTLVATPPSVVVGNPVTLTATATPQNGAPAVTSYAWDCDGSGTTIVTTFAPASTNSCPSYLIVGTFPAKVTVTGGSVSGSASTTVTVTPPPTPVVTVSCAQPTPPALTVHCVVSATLNGSSVGSGSITSVDWDFGDASPPITTILNSTTADHTYAGPATYPVLVSNMTVTGTTQKGNGSTSIVVH